MRLNETEKTLKKRIEFTEVMSCIKPEQLIFLDESGANLKMSMVYGRGYPGQRIIEASPFNRGTKLTLISAISIRKVEAALYGEWSVNGLIFTQFLEYCLIPQLKAGDIVCYDNVSFHKVADAQKLIESVGARLIYLPPYSPDLNPIEMMWSKIKIYLKKQAARTLETFQKAIKIAFESITSQDLKGWYKHCGYGSTI